MELVENLIVELTTSCNLKCIHCGYQMLRSHQVVNEAAFITAINKLKPLGLQSVMFTGGEPTLYPELIKIARFCKNEKLHLKIATNGSNLNPILTLLDESILDELVVSVDAINPMTYKNIRGKKLLNQIMFFVQEHPQYSNRIHFSYLIQKTNYRELIPFLIKCQSMKIGGVSLLVPHYGGDFTSMIDRKRYHETVFLSNSDVDEFRNSIAPQLLSFYAKNSQIIKGSPQNIDAIIEYLCNPFASHFFRSTICSFPLKTIFFYSDGKISPCPYHLDWKTDLESYLNNLKASRMRYVLEGGGEQSYCHHCLEVPL